MALFNGLPKSNGNVIKQMLCSSIQLFHKAVVHKSEADVIDEFTTELIQNKVNKWQTFRETRIKINKKLLTTILDVDSKNTLDIDIRQCKTKEIDNIITQFLNEQDFEKASLIVKQCVQYRICPSEDILLRFLTYCSRIGDCNSIYILQDLLQESDTGVYQRQGELRHYIAEATWIRGDILESLKIFEQVYHKHTYLRRRIHLVIKYLTVNIISERSEAMLVNLMNFAEKLSVKYNDYHLLVYVWQICFLSDWYADQCRAQEILDRHPRIINIIAKRVYPVVKLAVRLHKPEVIHNLLEILLKYKVDASYESILHTLFDYRYSQNDVRGCAEIIKWAAQIKVNLPPIIERKFILLLTGDKSLQPKTTPAKDFDLKF